MATTTLRLGKIDKGKSPKDIAKFLSVYHPDMSESLKAKLKFRDEGNGVWRPLQEITGSPIQNLQQFLKDAGFMPNHDVDGIYGYTTHAAVRLFQEYVRTVDEKITIGTPDGIAGPNTLKHIEQWKTEKANTPDFVCRWAQRSSENPTSEFTQWIEYLEKGKAHYLANVNSILKLSEQFTKANDTKKIKDWSTDQNAIHLIGVRRNQDKSAVKRENDDLFVLLIRGMVFYFWGSTDPNPGMADRSDIPFLIEGQHQYRFGWHKIGNAKKIYKALRPATNGVLVFRDRDFNKALTEKDVKAGLDKTPNKTINIHWSGIGRTNFSAGCQVIAGKSYLNEEGDLIDCSGFASPSYADLGKGKTRGAYNILADLILCYAPKGMQTVNYTLGQDDTVFLAGDDLNTDLIGAVVDILQASNLKTK